MTAGSLFPPSWAEKTLLVKTKCGERKDKALESFSVWSLNVKLCTLITCRISHCLFYRAQLIVCPHNTHHSNGPSCKVHEGKPIYLNAHCSSSANMDTSNLWANCWRLNLSVAGKSDMCQPLRMPVFCCCPLLPPVLSSSSTCLSNSHHLETI